MKTKISLIPLGVLLWVAAPLLAQNTVFFTSFEYDQDPIVIEPAELNGADDQVGMWSGDQIFPEGIGDILVLPDSIGFATSPYGGSLLLLDRPGGDPDNDLADLTGSYFADFTEPVGLIGAEVSFQVGTRRTDANHEKDYDVIGRDSNGAEVFHLRVGTNNSGGNRLGYVDADGNAMFDFATSTGEDKHEDLGNIGGFNLDDGPGANQEIANVLVRLGPDGYVVDFSYPEESTSNRANAYVTELIAYNSEATDLAQLEFTYEASSSTGRNSGYVLDDIRVTGLDDILLGDFDSNGSIDMADFTVLSDNFGTGLTFAEGDMNFDGQVGIRDFIALKAAFNAQAAGAASVPEPAGLGLLTIAGLFLSTLRHRRVTSA